jgi:hypothetical protein
LVCCDGICILGIKDMTGIFLTALAAFWIWAAIALSRWVGLWAPGHKWQRALSGFVFLLLLVAPLADEVIGKQQFGALCRKYAVQVVDEQNASNRRVIYVPRGPDKYASGTAVKIRIDPIVYKDIETNKILVSYHTLHAEGGWLIRAIGLSETNAPLLFPSGCAPENQDAFKQKFQITVVN